MKRAYYIFVVKAYLGVRLFSDSISGFCVGNEAATFLNGSFRLEPATPVLCWENKLHHIISAGGRSVGRSKVGIMFVARMS